MVTESESSSPFPPLHHDHEYSIRNIFVTVRTTVWFLFFVILLGSLLIWVMMPTSTYKHIWLPSIRAKADSTTFLGSQGSRILMYTFPILFAAVLGCVYLHLGRKCEGNYIRNGDKSRCSSMWKRPVLVKGPLGIVTMTELFFLTMFIALLIWSFSTYLYVSYSKLKPKTAEKDGEQMWEVKLESAALRLGLVGNICLAFLFFPVTRGSSVLPLIGLTSEASVKYHIWLGHIVMILLTAHGLCYVVYWAATDKISEMIKWQKVGISNVAGELSLVAGLFMWATSFPFVRRKFFELFFYTHQLYTLFMIFFVLHVGIAYSCIMLPGFYLFLIDRYLRFLQSRKHVRLLSARVLPCDTIELNFSKCPGLCYNPTSIIFINVPSISKLQWHPFSISSSSNLEPEKLSVILKSEGSWSQMVYKILSSPKLIEHLDVSVEGPYGPRSTDFLRHETLVMISGGSGITPFISIIRELISKSRQPSSRTPRVLLIAAFKNSADLAMLDLLLPISTIPFNISRLQIQIEAYVTRGNQPTSANYHKKLKAIFFNPNPSDTPIASILGSNSWFWHGAIISSSFVTFLILLGFINRLYIYPIDHNTNKIYPTSSKAIINMLLICICIAMASSLAVLWNKKQNNVAAKHIQGMDNTMPRTSSSFWMDREVESQPYQSLVQATNVHFGSRPDLKRLLSECEESSVGVLVCGPKKLRHEVATICSSSYGHNLHLESISFSW